MTTTTESPIQPAGRRRSGPASPSLVQSIGLVAEREVKMRLRSKTFLISTGILLLVILAGIVVGGFLAKNTASETTKVAVVGNAGAGLVDGKTFDVTEAADVAAAEALVKSGDVEAAIAPATDDNPTGVQVIFDSEASNTLIMQLSAQPQVTILDPDADGSAGFLLYIVSLGFGLVFFVSATTFGASIAQSVVEEKQTRVVEILMSAIPVKALLAGKVLGNSILAFGQILAIAALSVIGLTVTGQTELLAGLGTPVVWFVVFFVLGFILLAALFAAAGSLVSRQEDIGSTTTPITMLIMIPYFAVIFFNDNPVVMTIMSYVPFSAAVGMPVRLFVGSAQWWEPILSLLILAITAALVILVGSRIYENSLLKMGGRVKLSEALKA
ncbi:ABC-2 type transport system permease protein [Plantibacter sp. VKM Ac-1784]|uniref:ABC-2 type transport system permease protein n=1 Tax=Plantibacter elymi (nom. nud.) TaxID=199708 RepID=A0ABY1RBD1_9MICO|nr:ABC transporter permease [Plantibacter sp. VKM Ac-1784]SMQ64035.1 ABC-2 type transport system permease protein [Plantibacter sp. VKM Ac-1784]